MNAASRFFVAESGMVGVAEPAHGSDGGEDADVDENARQRSNDGDQLKQQLQLRHEMGRERVRLRGQSVGHDGVRGE